MEFRNEKNRIDKNNVLLDKKATVTYGWNSSHTPTKQAFEMSVIKLCIYILLLTMKGNYYFVNSINYDMRKKTLGKYVLDYMIKS